MRGRGCKLKPVRKLWLSVAILTGSLSGQGQTARVYVYQTRIPSVRANPIFCDGAEIGKLRHKWSYFVVNLPAGEHTFKGRHQENQIVLDLASGEDYYLRLDQVLTWPSFEKLVRERSEDGRAMIASGKMKPEAR